MGLKIGLVSLGCSRNLVDSEKLLSDLNRYDCFSIVSLENNPDCVVVNTCGFIDKAKQENIEVILDLIERKKSKKIKNVVIWGCLVERYKDELKKELGLVDGFFGVTEINQLRDFLKKMSLGYSDVKFHKKTKNISLSAKHYGYLKIAEGCNNNCSYCVLPKIKGRFLSRSLSSVTNEARDMILNEKKSEINIIAQDTLYYGMDLYKKKMLAEIIEDISSIDRHFWIRILYANPFHLDDSIIDVIKNNPRVCKYIDVPIQHISDGILKKMKRPISETRTRNLIDRLRREIPEIALRSTVIVGFPGETESDFKKLISFVKSVGFDRLGVFMYSREEGTKAFGFKGQVPQRVKQKRYDAVMSLQKKISTGKNKKMIGDTVEVLIDEVNKSDKYFIGRTYRDAPEVDGCVYVNSKNNKIKAGDFVNVKITGSLEYDLIGEILRNEPS